MTTADDEQDSIFLQNVDKTWYVDMKRNDAKYSLSKDVCWNK